MRIDRYQRRLYQYTRYERRLEAACYVVALGIAFFIGYIVRGWT